MVELREVGGVLVSVNDDSTPFKPEVTPGTPKILAMCEGGNNRSGGLAYILKTCYHVEAMQIGWHFNSVETIHMMSRWADYIVVMQPWAPDITNIPEDCWHKMRCIDVGPDIFHSNTNLELLHRLSQIVDSWRDANWKL